jgi:hypothetical protein
MRLHRISALRGHGLLLLLRAHEPVSAFRWNRAPAALLVYPIWSQEIQELFPMPQRKHVHVLPQVVDQVVAVVADEDVALLDGLDERLHPAWRGLDRQAGGLRRQNHPDLTLLHGVKQAGKRLAALAEFLGIGEIPQLAVVRCRINRCLAVVVRLR